jgi:uncharacterized protein
MQAEETKIQDTTGNPAPLGLFGFGITTILLNLHNSGLFPVDTMIFAMGIFCGGWAQIFAGLLEWKKGNTFGMTAFTLYGVFWLSWVVLNLLPKLGFPAPSEISIGYYLLMWGIFTFFMFFGTLKSSRALQFVFASLTVLFFLLAIRDFTGSKEIGLIAGIEGIICGASAFYTAAGEIINGVHNKSVLPLGVKKV